MLKTFKKYFEYLESSSTNVQIAGEDLLRVF